MHGFSATAMKGNAGCEDKLPGIPGMVVGLIYSVDKRLSMAQHG
jgi:hypothetical protein